MAESEIESQRDDVDCALVKMSLRGTMGEGNGIGLDSLLLCVCYIDKNDDAVFLLFCFTIKINDGHSIQPSKISTHQMTMTIPYTRLKHTVYAVDGNGMSIFDDDDDGNKMETKIKKKLNEINMKMKM